MQSLTLVKGGSTVATPNPIAAPPTEVRKPRPKPKPNLQPMERVRATLYRELPWHQCEGGLEYEIRDISVIVLIAYTDAQIIESIQSNSNNWTWQVQSISRPSTKGGHDNDF